MPADYPRPIYDEDGEFLGIMRAPGNFEPDCQPPDDGLEWLCAGCLAATVDAREHDLCPDCRALVEEQQ